jgi:hypothetical protein
MKRIIMIAAMIAAFGLGGAAAFAGTSDKPPSPPGQAECEHGNSQKPCKDDPQPDKGKDCDEHGNSGGVNEDHCKNETTPTETTPTETTPTETTPTETTPTETTPTETTPTDTTSTETTPAETSPEETTVTETTSSEPAASPEEEPQVFTPPSKKPVKVAAINVSVAKPSNEPQPAPLTP